MFVTEHVVSPIISMSLYSKTDVVEGDGPNPVMYYNPTSPLNGITEDIVSPGSAVVT